MGYINLMGDDWGEAEFRRLEWAALREEIGLTLPSAPAAEQVIRRHRDSPCMSSLEMTRGAPSLVVEPLDRDLELVAAPGLARQAQRSVAH